MSDEGKRRVIKMVSIFFIYLRKERDSIDRQLCKLDSMYLELAFSNKQPLDRSLLKIQLNRLNLSAFAKEVANNDKRVRALEMVLCNCVQYQFSNYPIPYSRDHITYPSEKVNPNGITARPLIAVIDALGKHGFIDNKAKSNRWGKAPEPNAEDTGHTSEFIIKDEVIELAKLLGITKKTIFEKESTHLRLKPYVNPKEGIRKRKMFLDYDDDAYTRRAEQRMKAYSDFIRKQKIQLVFDKDTIIIEPQHLRRQYRDYDNSNSLIYEGRFYPYWVRLTSKERKHLKINNNKTVSLDFKSSQIRWLYLWHKGEVLDPDYDAYDLEVNGHKINRDIVKKMNMYLLNVDSPLKQTRYLKYWHEELDDDGKKKKDSDWSGKEQAKIFKETLELKGVTTATMRNAYLNKHNSIRQYFLEGTKGGQYVAWIESNIIYELAYQATLKGIPCLIVHDEFIVQAKFKQEMEELMYTHKIYDTANMNLDDPFDYRGYAQWRLHRGKIAPAHKGSITTLEF